MKEPSRFVKKVLENRSHRVRVTIIRFFGTSGERQGGARHIRNSNSTVDSRTGRGLSPGLWSGLWGLLRIYRLRINAMNMKHGQNNRRQRSRGNGRRYPNQKGGAFESSGPEVKVRGTAQQVLEKYQSLARDAYSSGDRILAEGYLQHAEHYYRILNTENEGQNRDNNRNRQSRGNRDEDFDPDLSEEDEAAYDASHANGNGNSNGNGNGRNRSDGRGDDRNSHNSNDGDNRTEKSDAGNEQPAMADASADATNADNAKSETGDEGESRPDRKPRGRRPRKAEQSEPAVEQPVAGD